LGWVGRSWSSNWLNGRLTILLIDRFPVDLAVLGLDRYCLL
jgi:hypothetical protein